MTKKRFQYNVNKNSIEYDGKHFAYCNAEQSKIAKKLNELNDECDFLEFENEALEDGATKYSKLYHKSLKENEQLKKGMIRVVDRYIKNVECNPPSSARTYMKIKGALVNIREDLRNLISDLE